ncbi:MAG TPA: HAD family phosphatase [Solirubrobacteraceae bacterium]|nr:HAD family phosphatase [Solirubrobacteraceae bacterium]
MSSDAAAPPAAVIFDLDGVLLDSEQLWNRAKEELVRQAGGRWRPEASRAMMGMSSPEWSRYLRDELGVGLALDRINDDVVARMERMYRQELPLLPGAVSAVRLLSRRWPLGLASSSNRALIDLVLDVAGLADAFAATVSSEEVPRGKPAPDVYVETARRLQVPAEECVAIEDSSNGLRSAHAAGMAVIAVPNPHYPPDADAVALAAASVGTPGELSAELVAQVARRSGR